MTSILSKTNYTKLLRHSLQLLMLLTFSTFVQSLYVLDLANGRQLSPSTGQSNSGSRNLRGNWQPGSFWRKSKRSSPSTSSLPQDIFTGAFPGQNLPVHVPYSTQLYRMQSHHKFGKAALLSDLPMFRESTEGRRIISDKKMLKKMKQLAAIRDALRHRDKLMKLKSQSKELQNLEKAIASEYPTQTDEVLVGTKFHHNNMKSRRAKIMEVNRRLGPDVPRPDSFTAGRFADGFSPLDSRVEMFPKSDPFKGMGSFGSDHGFEQFESNPNTVPFKMLSESPRSGFVGSPVNGFYDSFNPPSSQGNSNQFGEVVMFPTNGALSSGSSMGSFGGQGVFVDDDRDCPTIATKSCASDLDCSCHGFYSCGAGRCALVQTAMQGEKAGAPTGTWHDQPTDFGFFKRSRGNGGDERIKADQNEAGE